MPDQSNESSTPTLSVADVQAKTLLPEETPVGDEVSASEGYDILEELGRGGMGVVYKARDVKLNRIVALKMIRTEQADENDLARFRTEAEAIARLQHPGIVQIFEIGEQQDRPFFSLEFCSGGSLDKQLRSEVLSPEAASSLVETLARSIHAAHEVHVIHRDLKPANVLIAADGSAKITDFGLAKKLDDAGQTQSGAIMGTPSYMAPEQAFGKIEELGPACDIYALGAILYECLTGRPPFKAATLWETLDQVRSQEAASPCELNAQVPRDLGTICLKCLKKEPSKRYHSALGLAEDLQRFEQGKPVAARPVGQVERAWSWCKRNSAVASLLALVMVVLLVGVGVSTYFAYDAVQKSQEAEEARAKEERRADAERAAKDRLAQQKKATEVALTTAKREQAKSEFVAYSFQIDAARQAVRRGHLADARSKLQMTKPTLRSWEYDFVFRQTIKLKLDVLAHEAEVNSVAFSPAGKRIVSGSSDNTVKVWDTVTGKEALTLSGHTRPVYSVAFGPAGKRIVSGSSDNTVKVWDTVTGKEMLTLKGHTQGVRSVAFSADGKRIASGSFDNTVKVWDTVTDKEAITLYGHTDRVRSVAFSSDGKRIVSGGSDNTVKVWDAVTGKEALTLSGHTGPAYSVAFGPAGKRIVSGSLDNTVKVWDTVTGKEMLTLKGHTGAVYSVAFSPDGKWIVSGSTDNTVKVWDAVTGKEARTLSGHTGDVDSVAFSPDGKRIVSGSFDNTVKVWDAVTDKEVCTLSGHTGYVTCVVFSPDGKWIVSGSGVWDQKKVKYVGGEIKVWDAATGKEAHTIKGHTSVVTSVAFGPAGKRIVSGSSDNTVKVWDTVTGKEMLTLSGHTGPVNSVAFSPDGKWIVSGSRDRTVMVWNAVTGKEARTLSGHTSVVTSVAFSPAGKRIVSGSSDNTVKVWDTVTGKEAITLSGHKQGDRSVAFSADGKRIASGSFDNTVKVWDAVTGKEARTLSGHTDDVHSVAFSPDGKWIVSGSRDRTVMVWDTVTGKEAFALINSKRKYR